MSHLAAAHRFFLSIFIVEQVRVCETRETGSGWEKAACAVYTPRFKGLDGLVSAIFLAIVPVPLAPKPHFAVSGTDCVVANRRK